MEDFAASAATERTRQITCIVFDSGLFGPLYDVIHKTGST